MGDAGPGHQRPPGASFTIEYLLSAQGDVGLSPQPPGRSPTAPSRPPAEPGDKPAQSYIALISTAILSSPEKKLLLSDIYQWIMDHYPYFKNKEKSWRNSVRHNLSLNECFVKAGRSDNGKGHFWAIHPANLEDFAKGDYQRRRARRRVRRVNVGFYHPYALYGCCCPWCPPAPPVPPMALPPAPQRTRWAWGRLPAPWGPLLPRAPFL
ncbi:forkhead box protein L2-like [Melopsittacus undulatus]|uniref:forkhead box protein L2-like n=1 Tax=Melopsittacus undulatus TaxID=13146 RepID=UPI00146F4C15|nr:forkhead box protein L2-like [Melopsittacus undulatus]